MKYAVISDVHGNMDALEAVLADARKQGAEGYLFAGDYCLSLPYPEEVINTIRKIENAVIIRGNEEQYIERMRGEREERWAGGQMHIHAGARRLCVRKIKNFFKRCQRRPRFGERTEGQTFLWSIHPATILATQSLENSVVRPFRSCIRKNN